MANKVEQFQVVWFPPDTPEASAVLNTYGLALRSYALHLARGDHPLMERRYIETTDWEIFTPQTPKET